MRSKLSGFVVSVLMVMAVGGLTAPPSFATDYFVKYLKGGPGEGCNLPPPAGPRIGSAVFRRTTTSMFATAYLRGAAPNTEYAAVLWKRPTGGGACEGGAIHHVTTDGSGNATVHLGSFPRKGNEAFWVEVVDLRPGDRRFFTVEVPSFGF
jgi:hypothetical protein